MTRQGHTLDIQDGIYNLNLKAILGDEHMGMIYGEALPWYSP
jgi:hypothetical protein